MGHTLPSLAVHLQPFAGIAFLWFIAVIRDRLGQQEDKFFATVFFGSGLLLLATLFGSAAVAGGVLRSRWAITPAGSRRSSMMLVLALSFSLVITLIAALDQRQGDSFPLSQQPLADLRTVMAGREGRSPE